MIWKNKHNLLFVLLTFFLAYIQATEAKSQSSFSNLFLPKSKEEKEVAEMAEHCLMRIYSDEELNMLPRTLLIASERDILRDQGLNLAERMCGKIQRIEYKGAVHLFITVPGQEMAFDRAVKDAIRFISNK